MSKLDHNGIEIIKDKFYFTTFVPSRLDNNTAHYFTVEDELTYEPFFADFGPLNLGHVYSYCHFLDQKLKDETLAKKKIYHYTGVDGAKRTNAVFLIGAYCVLVLRWSAEMVYRNFVPAVPLLLSYRDASMGTSTFGLTVLECWKGLIKANSCGFFDLQTFDPNEYYFYERVENGDMNWILPGKFLAFSGPHASHHSEAGLRTLTPEDYIPYFKKHNVAAVVRLNKKVYDKKRFVDYGIKHHDLYFVDGSTPSDNIVQRFLEIVENETGAIAVHCKAGLGRTGTLIGCSLIKHHKFTAHEAIAWLRICRPGSVIGPQQHFLVQMQSSLWKEGDLYRKKLDGHTKSAKMQLLRGTSSTSSAQLQSDYNNNTTTGYETAVAGYNSSSNNNGSLAAGGSGAVTTTSTTSTSTTSTSTTKSHAATKAPPPSSSTTTITTTTQITTSSLVPNSNTGNSLVDGNYLTSNAPPSANTKERLKADMRLITATLKSMRTTPPTTPTHVQPPPKFSSSTDLTSSPYASNNLATTTASSSSSSSSTPSTSMLNLHHNLSNSGGGSSSVSHSLANSTSSATTSNGTHRSLSPSAAASSSPTASSSSAAITNFYLNSPYAPSRSYSSSRSSSNPSTTTTKTKSPSGLSLQHRKIENQAHRSPTSSSPSSSSAAAGASSSSSSSSLHLMGGPAGGGGGGGGGTQATGGNSRQQSTKNLTGSTKLATRGTSPTVIERHASPSSSLSSSLSRSLASSTASTSSSSPHHTAGGPTSSSTSTVTTKPSTIYHRKSRSSGNVLAASSSSSSSSSSSLGPPSLAASSSSASFSSPNGSFATRPNGDFAVHSHHTSTTTTTRSISNGPPSSSYHHHHHPSPFYSSSSTNGTAPHSGSAITGVGNFSSPSSSSSSFHLSGSLQPAPVSSSALRSKTPSPPRRHSSVSKNINYPSYLVDTYQKKSEHHSRGYLRP